MGDVAYASKVSIVRDGAATNRMASGREEPDTAGQGFVVNCPVPLWPQHVEA